MGILVVYKKSNWFLQEWSWCNDICVFMLSYVASCDLNVRVFLKS